MKNPVHRLLTSLEDAIDLIDDSHLLPNGGLNQLSDYANSPLSRLDFSQASSLLEKCDNVESQYANEKPVLRIIHHFACSGGTLISKCISALPNVFLLSEVHPLSVNHLGVQPKYLPSDITTLARYAQVPDVDELAKSLFVSNIKETYQFLLKRGGTLLLREHTHIDFCIGETVAKESTVEAFLETDFKIKNLVTVRNPIDSYISLCANGWVQFSQPSFDEYCYRLIQFVNRYPKKNIVRYEDFVQHPDKNMRKMCDILDLKFDSSYRNLLGVFTLTGDSGRRSEVIELRERRTISEELLTEIKSSKNFKEISRILKYNKDI